MNVFGYGLLSTFVTSLKFKKTAIYIYILVCMKMYVIEILFLTSEANIMDVDDLL
jgi:hypothetical protein